MCIRFAGTPSRLTVREELCETKEELLAHADAIIKKLGSVNLNGKRNGRHTAEQKKVCLACWTLALENEELKSNTETGKATYPAAFNWYKSKLALVGVVTAKKFVAVMRTINNTNSANSIKELEAKIDASRKAKKNLRTEDAEMWYNSRHEENRDNDGRCRLSGKTNCGRVGCWVNIPPSGYDIMCGQ